MLIKYNIELDINIAVNSLNKLISKVFKILPLKEEGSPKVKIYIENLIIEILGFDEILLMEFDLLSVASRLEEIKVIDEHVIYRRVILGCTEDIRQMIHILKGGESGCLTLTITNQE